MGRMAGQILAPDRCLQDPHGPAAAHPHDRTIPLILAGGRVVSGELAPCSSLLDVPATVAWAMGVPVPAGYAGRAMVEAFIPAGSTEPAAGPAIPAVAQRYAFVAPR